MLPAAFFRNLPNATASSLSLRDLSRMSEWRTLGAILFLLISMIAAVYKGLVALLIM